MLIETFSGVWLNPNKVVNYQIGVSDNGTDHCTILAEVSAWRGYGTVASFDTRELAASGMRRLARLLADPGRALITQEDIHCKSEGFIDGNWVGRALMACVRDAGGLYVFSAEEMQWREDDGSILAEHGEDGSLRLTWNFTEAGMARQQERWKTPRFMGGAGPQKIVPDQDAPPLKYRLGWTDSKGEQKYDIPELDADFDTVKDREKWLREWGTTATQIFDPGVYHVDFGGALVRMEG